MGISNEMNTITIDANIFVVVNAATMVHCPPDNHSVCWLNTNNMLLLYTYAINAVTIRWICSNVDGNLEAA